ncbi:DUF1716-domain-containing protein [Basidiobolus meristosporus CBS 931.73]|uniref:DUF1716-domain-containing protein n=1 Tax=Basidiobolus meristosporus CBS 931.73 TaxID=1314790 RepID=A0A1Y1XVY2_9FUNG|nr:DUF1716-domain-containing protein [Basidiobolus meristosporus CBS 931.73]|eukprot:ORX89907.1 DUF1716-domain-containing protein [Basidiobolus meristosporus CBS 931.73]
MDINSLFKAPAIPSGRNKRKLPAAPSLEMLKKFREEEEGESSILAQEPQESEELDGDSEGRFFGDGLTDEQRNIFEFVDAGDELEAETFDVNGVKKMVLKLEKAINKNQEMRMKFPDSPEKFLDSEAELDEEIKHFAVISEAPEMYTNLIELNAVASILSLLSHENTDIAISAVELLNALTEEDDDGTNEEAEESMKLLVQALVSPTFLSLLGKHRQLTISLQVDNQGLDILIQNLNRLDESLNEDRNGVFQTLAVVENLISIEPEIAEIIVSTTPVLSWLLNRINVKSMDSNKQYCSEILAILFQDSRVNRLKANELDGIDKMLRVLNSYKRKDPKDADEIEFMENVFDALSSCLQEPESKPIFLECEGNELMLIMLKEKVMSRMRALKVLNYATATAAGANNCKRFVDILGLKTLFSVFMKKGVKKLKKAYKNFSDKEEEEHVMCIIVSLLRYLPDGVDRLRLFNKFNENDFEKVDRLVELFEAYIAKAKLANEEIERSKQELLAEEEEITSEDETQFYLKRLDAGLFTLQMTAISIGYLCKQDEVLKKRVVMLLSRKSYSLQVVKDTLQDYLTNLGDGDSENPEDPALFERKRISELMQYLE